MFIGKRVSLIWANLKTGQKLFQRLPLNLSGCNQKGHAYRNTFAVII
jgi:hypothetical protein